MPKPHPREESTLPPPPDSPAPSDAQAEAARVREGLARFDAGAFHAAHDAFEDVWRTARGPRRALLQALVLAAAGWHQRTRGKEAGARTLFRRGLARLRAAEAPAEGGAAAPVDAEGLAVLLAGWAAAPPAPGDAPPRLGFLADAGLAEPPQARGAAHPDGDALLRCPYCGETVPVEAEALGPDTEAYVEDCPVCCRPWTVRVRREDGRVRVRLQRDDDGA